jgi:hypothetical protein
MEVKHSSRFGVAFSPTGSHRRRSEGSILSPAGQGRCFGIFHVRVSLVVIVVALQLPREAGCGKKTPMCEGQDNSGGERPKNVNVCRRFLGRG